MRMTMVGMTLAAAGALLGCEAGSTVLVNEHAFALPGMLPRGSGCMTFELGGGSRSSSSGGGSGVGGPGASLAFSLHQADDKLIVQIREGATLLAQSVLDEAFFRSERVDELRATATTGEGLLLRHWGSYGPDGKPRCTALNGDDGTRPAVAP